MLKPAYHFVFTIVFMSFLGYTQAQSETAPTTSEAVSSTVENTATNTETDAPATLIAVATETNTETAEIHTQISLAPHFLFFSHEGSFLKSLPSPPTAQGKVDELSTFLVQQQVTVLIAAHFDENDLNSLTAHDIIPIERQGIALDEVMRLLQCEPHPPQDEAIQLDTPQPNADNAPSQTPSTEPTR